MVVVLLNIVLLAVLFSSLRSTGSNDTNCGQKPEAQEKEKHEKSVPKRCRSFATSATGECEYAKRRAISKVGDNDEIKVCNKEMGTVEMESLSEEELNRRAEAFITMFRQHLASDSRKKSKVVAAKTTCRLTK